MLRVGLTGGMGAGKSTVARVLAECGAVIIDSDLIAREVVAPGTEGLAALVTEFGPEILQADGSLDRPALAAKAFADDASRAALNAITHPRVGARTAELLAAAPADAVVVQDIPLLVENHLGSMFHLVIVVTAELELRVRRLVEHRGVDESDARARIAAQATEPQRRAAADVLLDNGGDRGAIDEAVRRLFHERLVPFEANVRARTWVRGSLRLAPPNPEWPDQAQRLIGRLQPACGADAVRIDHIGSTSVPGLPAPDTIDLQITVANLGVADSLADRLTAAGFPLVDITADDPHPTPGDPTGTDTTLWTKRLHASADPGRPAQVHIRADGAPGQQFALIFRDWLRAEPEIRAEYLALEQEAEAAASGLDPQAAAKAYHEVKAPWFDAHYPQAITWSQHSPA